MNRTLKVPKFETEAEEARWWFENEALVTAAFESAANDGTLRRSTLAERAARFKVQVAPVLLDPADAVLARELAAKRGERYEDFVRRVMHQALELEKSA